MIPNKKRHLRSRVYRNNKKPISRSLVAFSRRFYFVACKVKIKCKVNKASKLLLRDICTEFVKISTFADLYLLAIFDEITNIIIIITRPVSSWRYKVKQRVFARINFDLEISSLLITFPEPSALIQNNNSDL